MVRRRMIFSGTFGAMHKVGSSHIFDPLFYPWIDLALWHWSLSLSCSKTDTRGFDVLDFYVKYRVIHIYFESK